MKARFCWCSKLISAALVLCLGVAIAAPAFADGDWGPGGGDPFVLYFGEGPDAYYSQDGGPPVFIQGVFLTDPTQGGAPGGGAPPALTFFLPELVTNGEVQVFEPPDFQQVTDVLRFTNANGDMSGTSADRMIFYSDNFGTDPNPQAADISGLPYNLGAFGFASIGETGNEAGLQEFLWIPGGGNEYHGISDTPEPSSLALLGVGLVGLVAVVRRRRRK